MTTHEWKRLLESDGSAPLWAAIEAVEARYKNPLRRAKDPAWFIVDDIFNDLKAIPRRLGEENAVDAETPV